LLGHTNGIFIDAGVILAAVAVEDGTRYGGHFTKRVAHKCSKRSVVICAIATMPGYISCEHWRSMFEGNKKV